MADSGDPNGKGLPKWAPYASGESYLEYGDTRTASTAARPLAAVGRFPAARTIGPPLIRIARVICRIANNTLCQLPIIAAEDYDLFYFDARSLNCGVMRPMDEVPGWLR